MKEIIERGATSQIVHVFIPDSASATGAGKTGLTFNSATLKIVVMRPGEASATKYLQSAGNIEDITTLGTYAAPTASKCRFKEIDATDLPGWYELHFADALFNTTSSRRSLGGMISGAAGVAPTPFAIQLADPVRGVASPTALPNAAADAAGGLPISDAGGLDLDARIGTDIPAILVDTGTTLDGRLPAALVGGRMDSNVQAMADGVMTAAKFAAGAFDAVWTVATRTLSSISALAGEIRAALGLASANLDTQLLAIAAFIDTEVGELLTRLSVARAGFLDFLNIGGNVASSAEVTSIQNNTRCAITTPEVIERPDAGTTTYRVELYLYDSAGAMEAPDSAPTVALVNQAGTDRSIRLDSTTMALVSTGRYRVIYTADVGDALEQLTWTFSVVEGGATRVIGRQSLIVDTTAVDFTAADRTKVEAIFNKLPSKDFLLGTVNSDGDLQINEATGTPADSAGVGTLLTRASEARLSELDDTAGKLVAVADLIKTAADAIKLKTDGLPADPADQSAVEGAITTAQTALASAIAALNNLSSGDAQTATAAALTAAGYTSARAAKIDALPVRLRKNTAFANFQFLMVDSTDHLTGKTGLTVTAQRVLDGGALAACANPVVEIASGLYRIDLAAADLNGNMVSLVFTAAGADARIVSAPLQEAA